MKCDNVKNSLDSFIEGHMKKNKITAINKHLNECSSCNEEYKLMKKSIKSLKSIKAIPAPDNMLLKIHQKILQNKIKVSPYFFLKSRRILASILISALIPLIVILYITSLGVNYKKNNLMNYKLAGIYRYMSEDNYEEALLQAQDMLKTSPSQEIAAELMLVKGKCYQNLKEQEKAVAIYEEITEKFPKSNRAGESYYLLGVNQEDENNLIEAARNYSYVIENFTVEQFGFFEDLLLRAKTCEFVLAKQEELLASRGEGEEEKIHQKNLKKIEEIIDINVEATTEFRLKEAQMLIEKEEYKEGLNILIDIREKDLEENLKAEFILLKGKSFYGLEEYDKAEIEFSKIINDFTEGNKEYKKEAQYYLDIIIFQKNREQ